MDFVHELTLILARGLPADAAAWVAAGGVEGALDSERSRQKLCAELESRGMLRHGAAVVWPDRRRAELLAERLVHDRVRLVWRHAKEYPVRLTEWLGAEAPAWVWIAGSQERLKPPACAFVGSRQTAPLLLGAARRLAQALADAGIPIVSGMAVGADEAAHDGARAGRAGTIAIPARGMVAAGLSERVCRSLNMTAMTLGRPEEPFSAGLAIRRNGVIAAMGDGLVLVAGGLRGGSSYAVRWAISWRRPLWCFEAGRETPPANRHLIREGLATPLSISEKPAQWVNRIVSALERQNQRQKNADVQLDLLNI